MHACGYLSDITSAIMREFPVTVPSSHVYHINASASNLFDDDQYQRKLPTAAPTSAAVTSAATKQSCPNNSGGGGKNATNYICTSNGDLTSLQSGRLQNFTNINNIHNNNCNRSHKIVTAIKSTNSATANAGAAAAAVADKNVDVHNGHDGDINCADVNRASNTSGSYSIFDAITNAVTSGHCANTIYPANKRNDTADFDQINLSPDPMTANANTASAAAADATTPASIECGQFQHYNYHFNNRTLHQFPSANYKHSYLLWIGTPVAARYCVTHIFQSVQLTRELLNLLIFFCIFFVRS